MTPRFPIFLIFVAVVVVSIVVALAGLLTWAAMRRRRDQPGFPVLTPPPTSSRFIARDGFAGVR